MQTLMRRARAALACVGRALLFPFGIILASVSVIAFLFYIAWVSRKTGCPCCAWSDDDPNAGDETIVRAQPSVEAT